MWLSGHRLRHRRHPRLPVQRSAEEEVHRLGKQVENSCRNLRSGFVSKKDWGLRTPYDT